MSQRLTVPSRFTTGIETWLENLTISSYRFPFSPIIDNNKKNTICIGDIHADPRGLISALFIGKCINNIGQWIGNDTRVILLGDILDGLERIGKNPDITEWDELLCLRIIFELKVDAQKNGGDIIWVLGNHDIAAPMGQDHYLNQTQAKGYGPKGRQYWFRPGNGILSHYMAKCSIIGGKFNDILVSHAGVLKQHLPYILSQKGFTMGVRLWLIKGVITTQFQKFYNQDGPTIHRQYDVRPEQRVPINVIQELESVSKNTNTKIQIIGHNFRTNIQRIKVDNISLFLVDTGISRSFGNDTKVQILIIDQMRDTYGAFSVDS